MTEQPQDTQHIESASAEDLAAMMSAPPPPVEEVEQQEHVEGDEDEAHEAEETGDDGDADAPSEDDVGETDEPDIEAEPEKKRRSTVVSRDRFDKVNAKAKKLDEVSSYAANLERELQKARETNKLLVDRITGEAEEPEDEDIIDDVLDKKLSARLEKLEAQHFASDFQATLDAADAFGASKLPDYHTAVNFTVAKEAQQLVIQAAAIGRELTSEEAIAYAQQKLGNELVGIRKMGANKQTIAQYAYNKALAYGFAPKSVAKQQKSANINMDAVKRARDEAGAPAIQREAVKVGGAGKSWDQQLAESGKDKLDADYMRKMGLL